MKNRAAVIALAGGLLIATVVGGGLWWGYASNSRDTSGVVKPHSVGGGASAAGGKADPDTGRRVLYWHDPMIPGPKFDKPGKSPFMDMQLVPVYADEGADEGKVSISPRTLQNLGIRTAEVKQGTMTSELHTVGAVTIDERNLNTVQSRVNGYIEKLHVRAQYDLVKRGQPLVEIYAPEWLAAQQEYLTLKRATLPGADGLLQASRQRMLLLGISEQQIQRIERDGQANPRVTLYAPVGGVVWELGARDGQAVTPGMTLFRLAGLETVWVNAEVPEVQAALVVPGASVEARAAAWPNQVFKGRVAAILPEVNATTRTIKARVVLANPQGQLRPGMFARLELGGSAEPALMVPTEAVIRTGLRSVVVVAEGDGKFRPVEVEVGRESEDMTEIRKGLEAGQQVVASGQFLIDSEASLKSALSRMNDPGAPAPAAAPKTDAHRASGKVMAIEGGKITIQHGPIASANMGAMTMTFSAPSGGVPRNVEVGDSVSFEFLITAGDMQLTAITPEASAPLTPDTRADAPPNPRKQR